MAVAFLFTPLTRSADHYYSVAGMLQAFPLLRVDAIGEPNNMLLGDTITNSQPWLMYDHDSLLEGRIPLWNPYNANGTPHLGNLQSAVFSPFSLSIYLLSTRAALLLMAFLRLFGIGFFCFLYFRAIGLKRISACLGATAFMFCGYNLVWLNYTVTGVVLCVPASFYFLEVIFSRFGTDGWTATKHKPIWAYAGLTLSLAAGIVAGHPETFFFSLMLMLVYAVYRLAVVGRRLSSNKMRARAMATLAFGLVVSGSLAAGLCAIQLAPFLEYVALSSATGRSVGACISILRGDLWSLFFYPNLFGGGTSAIQLINSPALGTNYNEVNSVYIGALVLSLAVLAVPFARRNSRIAFFLITIGVWAVVGYNILGGCRLFSWIPGASVLFVQRSQVFFLFPISCCAAYGFDYLQKAVDARRLQAAFWTAMLGLITTSIGFLGAMNAIYKHAADISPVAEAYLSQVPGHIAAITATLIVGIGAVIVMCMARVNIVRLASGGVVLLMVFIQSGYLLKDYNTSTPDALYFPVSPSVRTLQEIVGNDVVVMVGDNTIPPDVNMVYRLSIIPNYDALGVKHYDQLTQALFGMSSANQNVRRISSAGLIMFGARYVLISDPQTQLPPRFEQVASLAWNGRLYRDTQSLSPFWVVGQARTVVSDDEALNTVQQPDFDPSQMVILKSTPSGVASTIVPDVQIAHAAEVIYQKTEDIGLRASCTAHCYLVLAKTYYPGWKATVDGQDVAVLRANYAFSAVELAPGDHTIRYYYDPISFKLGAAISVASLLMGVTIIGLVVWPQFRRIARLDKRDRQIEQI